MPRIIFLCPADNNPTGGIKVIYRHAELLRAMGADAWVLHPFESAFRCTWFDHDVRFLDNLTLNVADDFIIIPEIYAGFFGPQCMDLGVRYAIYVQNGYLTHAVMAGVSAADMSGIYCGADLLLAISGDTMRMVALNYPAIDPARLMRVQFSVHPRFLTRSATIRSTTITYMPRKMGMHALRVVYALQQHLPPRWHLLAIDGVDEATCAAMLFNSRIFLAFSEFEGFGLPPLEAALAANLVIGYAGQGALEYWDAPNFQEIHQGDIIGFVEAALRGVAAIESGAISHATLQPGIDMLATRYAPEAENAILHTLLHRIDLGTTESVSRHAA
jgi:hypothetical protein